MTDKTNWMRGKWDNEPDSLARQVADAMLAAREQSS